MAKTTKAASTPEVKKTKLELGEETLNELRTFIDEKVIELNKEYRKETPVLATINSIKADIKNAEEKYKTAATTVAFEKIIADTKKRNKTIIYGVAEVLTYDLYKVSEHAPKETGIMTAEADFKATKIDPFEVQKYAGVCVANSKEWLEKIGLLNFKLALRVCDKLAVDPEKKKLLRRNIKLPAELSAYRESAEAITISNNKLQDALDEIVKMCLGDDKTALSHDARYIELVYAKAGKGNCSVAIPDNKTVRMNLMQMFHNIIRCDELGINHSVYVLEYKAKKAN